VPRGRRKTPLGTAPAHTCPNGIIWCYDTCANISRYTIPACAFGVLSDGVSCAPLIIGGWGKRLGRRTT